MQQVTEILFLFSQVGKKDVLEEIQGLDIKMSDSRIRYSLQNY